MRKSIALLTLLPLAVLSIPSPATAVCSISPPLPDHIDEVGGTEGTSDWQIEAVYSDPCVGEIPVIPAIPGGMVTGFMSTPYSVTWNGDHVCHKVPKAGLDDWTFSFEIVAATGGASFNGRLPWNLITAIHTFQVPQDSFSIPRSGTFSNPSGETQCTATLGIEAASAFEEAYAWIGQKFDSALIVPSTCDIRYNISEFTALVFIGEGTSTIRFSPIAGKINGWSFDSVCSMPTAILEWVVKAHGESIVVGAASTADEALAFISEHSTGDPCEDYLGGQCS